MFDPFIKINTATSTQEYECSVVCTSYKNMH